jgi:hypothetical protein
MPTSVDYEKFVRDILEAELAKYLPSSSIRIRHNQKLTGKSGQQHQVDIVAELSLAGLNFLTLVECKHYQRKVGVDKVLQLASRLEDCAAHKGIIVTTVGFQAGAANLARANGIALVLVGSVKPSRENTGWGPVMGWQIDHDAAFLDWLSRQPGVGPLSENDIAWLRGLSLTPLGAFTSELSEDFLELQNGEPLIAYSIQGEGGSLTVNRDGLFVLLLLRKNNNYFARPGA